MLERAHSSVDPRLVGCQHWNLRIKTVKTKRFLFLFALPFAGFGSWMAYSIGSECFEAVAMRDWQPVSATLLTAGYSTHRGDDSTSYKAYATYEYRYGGTRYQGSRVGLSSGSDNIGDYQQDTGNALAAALARGEPVTVYVDPEQPFESIIDRSPRWGLMAFKSVFVLLFGGFGYALLIGSFLAPKLKYAGSPEFADAPWLANDAWQGSEIRSDSKSGMYGAWFFAGFWNLIAMPLPFLLFDEITEKQNYAALFGLIFPVVGLGLLYWAVQKTREWRYFGATPLTLDPFPGAIGGHVGGTIELALPFDSSVDYELSLSNLYSRTTGSGKNRSRRETARWQDRTAAHAEPGGKGTRLVFRFDVPEGLEASDAARNNDAYTLWRLSITADAGGRRLDRNWEIPVYPTAAHSRNIDERKIKDTRFEQVTRDERTVRERIRVRYGTHGKSLYYPAGRNALSSLIGLAAGLFFATAGVWLWVSEGAHFMGGVFTLVGSLVALSSIYMVGNSLEVFQDGLHIRAKRRLFGIPVRNHSMARSAFTGFEGKKSGSTQSGQKHTVIYKISALGASGQRVPLGGGFRSRSEKDAAVRIIAAELGLPLPELPSANDADGNPLEYNALAADN